MEQLKQFFSQPDFVSTYLLPWSGRIAMALVILIIGRWIVRAVVRALRHVLDLRQVDKTLTDFLANIVSVALLVAVVIAALDQLGVDTTSVMAVFATAGLAIGLALKDSLGNFASGVMLVLFRPFKAGDFIEAAGHSGTVQEIKIFSTLLSTPDNREIIIPNSQIYGGSIVNFSARDTRRIDLIIGVGYGDDLNKARALIQHVLNEDERVLRDPEPSISLGELGDSSVNLFIRPWVKSTDYWNVRCDLLENIKNQFDENGITIPFPHRELYIRSQAD